MQTIRQSFEYIFSKIAKKWVLLSIILFSAILLWIAVFGSARGYELKVYFFDVGQGDAILVEFPDGRQVLIDGGPDRKVVEKLNSVMPFWDRSIDIVIATHADADHISGLVPVLEHYKVSTVIWNGIKGDTKIFEEWESAVTRENAHILTGKYGMKLSFSDYAFLEIVHPAGLYENPDKVKQNEQSIVLRLIYGDDSFLFAGDIERQAEYSIVSKGINIKSDVLKVAHHGSKTSSSELFLDGANPRIAIISVGRNNPYNHPREVILQRLVKYGIEIRRTDLEGDIVLTSDGARY